MEASDTRTRLIEVASRHYANHGYEGMSLRRVTQEAEANIAAVSYHFGSKQQLLVASFRHAVDPVNAERLEQLERLRQEQPSGPLPLRSILDALLLPMAGKAHAFAGGLQTFLKCLARFMGESDEEITREVARCFSDVEAAFIGELRQTLSHLNPASVQWAFQFAVSSMIGTFLRFGLFQHKGMISGSLTDTLEMLCALRDFIATGLEGMPSCKTNPIAATQEARTST